MKLKHMRKLNKKALKNEKGITLIVLIIVIIVIAILTASITTGVTSSMESRNYANMQEDIKTLREAMKLYYEKNGKLPDMTVAGGVNKSTFSGDIGHNDNDNNTFYIIDPNAMNEVGVDYNRLTYGKQDGDTNDIFVVNQKSLEVYYLKGVNMSGINYRAISTVNK